MFNAWYLIHSWILFSVSNERRPVEDLFQATVRYDGNISWVAPFNFYTSCILDMTYFPWDIQQCPLLFSSWTFDSTKLDLYNLAKFHESGDTSFFVHNGQWIIEAFPATRAVTQYYIRYWDHLPLPITEVTYTMHLKRKPLFIFYNLILPSIFITFCAYLVFLLPPESGEKVSMSVTMLLAITVFLLLVAEHTPAQSEVIPAIGKCTLLLFLSFQTLLTKGLQWYCWFDAVVDGLKNFVLGKSRAYLLLDLRQYR